MAMLYAAIVLCSCMFGSALAYRSTIDAKYKLPRHECLTTYYVYTYNIYARRDRK